MNPKGKDNEIIELTDEELDEIFADDDFDNGEEHGEICICKMKVDTHKSVGVYFFRSIMNIGMSKTSPKTKGRRERKSGDYPTKRKSA